MYGVRHVDRDEDGAAHGDGEGLSVVEAVGGAEARAEGAVEALDGVAEDRRAGAVRRGGADLLVVEERDDGHVAVGLEVLGRAVRDERLRQHVAGGLHNPS